MRILINNIVSLSPVWRCGILMTLSLACAYFMHQEFLRLQYTKIENNKSKLLQLNNEINQYHRDEKQIQTRQQAFNALDQQLSGFEITLADFNQQAPERSVLDSAVRSNISVEEINISRQEQDEFGHYYLINISVAGEQENVSRFFSQLLVQEELAIWERLEFERVDDQLSLNLVSKYYFKMSDEIFE